MSNAELEMLMANLKSHNLAQAAKKDLNDLLIHAQRTSLDAVASDNRLEKDAVIMANLILIRKLVDEEIKLIDSTQKTNLAISEIFAEIAKKMEEDEEDE